jgi:hypothetical protein
MAETGIAEPSFVAVQSASVMAILSPGKDADNWDNPCFCI